MWAYRLYGAARRSLRQRFPDYFGQPTIYNVKLDGVPSLKADHNEQLLCTIEISLPEECEQGAIETQQLPQPSYKLTKDSEAEFETRSTSRLDNGQLKINTFGILTAPGNYKIQVHFPEGSSLKFTTEQSCCIKVTPGSLSEIRNVGRNISSICYPFDEQSITVQGLDVYQNKCPLDIGKWELDLDVAEAKKGFHQECECVCTSCEDTIQFKYYFDRPGNYTVSIKPRSEMLSHVKVPADSFTLRVQSPFDTEKSVVRLCDNSPLFIDSTIQIKVDLIPNHYIRKSGEYLDVRVNGDVIESVFDCITCTFSNIKIPVGHAAIEICHGDQLIGEALGVEVEGVVTFDPEVYIWMSSQSSNKILCKGITIRSIIGVHSVNLNNINRVLEGTDRIRLDQIKQNHNFENEVLIDMSNFNTVSEVYKMLCFLIKGSHYREQASTFDCKRMNWKGKATAAWEINKHDEANWCKSVKKKYGKLMDESHSKASDAFFEFYNYRRPQSKIDLHGQRTANEPSLQAKKQDLLRRYGKRKLTSDDKKAIESRIEVMREEGDEAIRHLWKRLRTFDAVDVQSENCDGLEVIVGPRNKRSDDETQKIRSKVEEFLSTNGFSNYIECHQESFLVPIPEHKDTQPSTAKKGKRKGKRKGKV